VSSMITDLSIPITKISEIHLLTYRNASRCAIFHQHDGNTSLRYKVSDGKCVMCKRRLSPALMFLLKLNAFQKGVLLKEIPTW
jgi:hypothetical protein